MSADFGMSAPPLLSRNPGVIVAYQLPNFIFKVWQMSARCGGGALPSPFRGKCARRAPRIETGSEADARGE